MVQVKEGDSIEAQEKRLRQFCEEKGYTIIGVYKDAGKSASISDDKIDIKIKDGRFLIGIGLNKRPAFRKLLEEANSGKFDAIVFFKWDRFSRDMIFSKISQIYFQRHGIELIPSDDAIDPLMVEIKSALSEEEIRKMKERVRLTRLKRFDDGIMTGRAPYGYRFDRKNKRMVIDKRKADIVKDVFDMAYRGIKYKHICEKHKLDVRQYYNIIRNKVYIGLITFEGHIRKGIHKPIISEDVFNSLNSQTILSKL